MSGSREYQKTIAAGEQDIDEMKEKLAKLRNLSDDDRTEAAMLRSRIDEQSNLIMMLKTRSDENLIRAQALDKANNELLAAREIAEEMLQQEMNKSNMLERRFFELSENHEQMIKLKDGYKRDNMELRSENQRLADALTSQRSKEDERQGRLTAELKNRLTTAEESRELLEEKLSVAESVRRDQEREHRGQLDALRSQLAVVERRAKEAEARSLVDAEAESRTNERLAKEVKEKQEYLDLAMQRGKLIQEKQQEMRVLQQKWEESERRMKEMADNFAREADTVNVNTQVKKLREDLNLQERRTQELDREYTAYKQHASKLLESEKELNVRLRNLFN